MPSEWRITPEQDWQVICPVEIDFSGAAVTVPLWCINAMPLAFGNSSSTVRAIIKSMFVMYTEAPPAAPDASYNFLLRIGTNANSSAVHDFTIPAGRAVGDVDVIDQADFSAEPRVFNSTEWVQLYCPGGASGLGKAYVGVRLSQDYRTWRGFTP